MLPNNGTDLSEITLSDMPGLTYRIDTERGLIDGTVDGADAIRQAAELILSTERFEHVIYSWNYGIETKDLFGTDRDYVRSELKRRITEALTQDSRITDVGNFEFKTEKGKIAVAFTVYSQYGETESGVIINV